MKKFFTLLALAVSALTVSAKEYTDTMVVYVNEAFTSQRATISVDEQADGKYTFTMKNFTLKAAGADMPVGTIELKDVPAFKDKNSVILQAERTLTIQAGDEAGVVMWTGPMLGDVPVNVIAELRDDQLYAIIDIDMQSKLGQYILVKFGEGGYQLPNAGFEAFHTTHCIMPGSTQVASTAVEPNYWHSFMSASGEDALVYMAGYAPHVFIANDARPGSKGTKSVKLTAKDMWVAIANGTMTTGRMNSGNMVASDYSNHAWMDITSSAADENGDPFFMPLNGRPDSLAVWVKYGQGTANANHPYATVSAVITDGGYYQEPSDQEYTSVVAKAKNNTIEATNGEWKRISVPFEYVENAADPKGIMITMSTNADPGQGSDNDSLLVDDIELIYKNDFSVEAFEVKGQRVAYSETTVENVEGVISADDIQVVGEYAKKYVNLQENENGVVATVLVASEDLSVYKAYTLNFPKATTGIEQTTFADHTQDIQGIYTVNGQKVSHMNAGQVYIVRLANGKTMKVIK